MLNQKELQTLMKRARWDRLFGALIVLVLFIILIACMFKSCGKEKEPGSADVSTIDPVATEQPTTEPVPDNSTAIFLSPSTQEDKLYACNEDVSEKLAMFELANSVKALLENEGYTVYMCGDSDNVKAKVNKGNELKCGAYIALHSNAGGDDESGDGAACFYNPDLSGSLELAQNVYNRVKELTPTEDRPEPEDGCGTYYELVNNQNPCCLLEVGHHDTESQSQWILDNKDSLAKSIKDGIVAFLNNTTGGMVPGYAPAGEDGDIPDAPMPEQDDEGAGEGEAE